ncbi:Non-essential IMV membrane protein [Sea otter poxvirus]|uniref:Non-essential IMV membrane protein n=1 Tax=Sea otter poxvirus TaxID=1416741 RepID=A0A2U9QHR9_9POXV|nr:Non-essential IMV membrane protein [Sea otter poxvirus]AWU47149.1 Non-essential IMV membrane protein [Sea otter poxvirus]
MITNYEPSIILGIFFVTVIFNILLNSQTKLDIVFTIQTVVFIWFMFHFIHSMI